MILSTCRKPFCLFGGKKSTSSLMLSWRYCKDMQIYFGYFGHAWFHTPKMIVSACARLRCLSACKKHTSSLVCLLRYYILKNPGIWLADSIKNLNFVRYEIGGEITTTLVSILDDFPEQIKAKLFKKSTRNLFGPFWPGKN